MWLYHLALSLLIVVSLQPPLLHHFCFSSFLFTAFIFCVLFTAVALMLRKFLFWCPWHATQFSSHLSCHFKNFPSKMFYFHLSTFYINLLSQCPSNTRHLLQAKLCSGSWDTAVNLTQSMLIEVCVPKGWQTLM